VIKVCRSLQTQRNAIFDDIRDTYGKENWVQIAIFECWVCPSYYGDNLQTMRHIRMRVFAKIRAAIFKNLFDILAFSSFVLLYVCVCVISVIVEFKAVSLKSGKSLAPVGWSMCI